MSSTTGWLLRLSRLREAAGAVSGRLQQRLDRLQQLVFILLGLSVILFHFYAHRFDYDVNRHRTVHDPIWLAGFTFTLILAIAVVAWDWWVRLDQRRLDSRALAEGLRVRRFWSLAGIGRSVTDSYVGQLRSELSWIRQAVFHSCPPAPVWAEQFDRLPEAPRVASLEKVRLEWVQGQHDHYHRRQIEMDRAAARFHVTGLLLTLVGWAALSLLLFAGPSTPLSPRYPPHWFLIAPTIAVILGGLLSAYSERRSHEELARQYERMEVVFGHALHELERHLDSTHQPLDIAGAQRVIEALGREALLEHSQWLILRRARPLELHIG